MGSIGSCHAGAENPGHLTNAHLANGHLVNGHLVNGHLVNGHLANGHLANGHLANGHLVNGHLANGHLANGHLVNGHLANGHLANKCMGGTFGQQTILAKFLFAFLPHFCNVSFRNCPLDTGYSVIELNKTVIEMRHFVCWPNVPPCTYWPNVRWPIVR